MPLHRERLYPPHKIAALVKLLSEDGVPAEATLRGTSLDHEALGNVSALTSIEQYLLVCRNAIQLSRDRSLAFRLGQRLHLADYGMYGLLMLSCESVHEYFGLTTKYQLLATPALAIGADTSGSQAVWSIAGESARDLPDDLRAFLIEQQFAQLATHLHDVVGASCRPAMAFFAYPAPTQRAFYSQYLRCPCVFDWHCNELRYPKETLAQRPYLANPLAAASLRATCDGLLADLEASLGFAGKVYRTLRHMRDPGTSMKAVASVLKMTDRTLRRRLADEGTSFSTIAHNVKYGVATQHLKESRSSIEQIAAIAGFSDPANFRRAFIRWTSMSPAEFRRMQHR
jgi:AraC-like DNA-binding protein